MVCVIDMEGYMCPEFSPKELTISNGKKVASYLFKSPCAYRELKPAFKRQATWVYHNYHGIPFEAGYIELSELPQIIKEAIKDETVIFCKGKVKQDLINKYSDKQIVINLDNICPNDISLKNNWSKNDCYYHQITNYNCSLNNVRLICKYLNINTN